MINGSKIAAVGSIDEVDVTGAEIIDAKGKTVIPGFIDCHTHFILMGVRVLITIDLSQTKSLAEVVDKVKKLKGANGYNAQTEEYEDLLKAGVIDPTKVVRTALQNAASVAGLLLTTEALIAEKPDENAPGAGGMPDMGGMGGMGDMGMGGMGM